ncbi:MAG TPA: hypothetical protein VMY69_09315, partial [Phycisphaerae bacterium]|nr:hypothetical protein [Phycisphaerae bacterium]
MEYSEPNSVEPSKRWNRNPTFRPCEPHLSPEERERRNLELARGELRVTSLLCRAGLPVAPSSRQALRRRLVDGICLGAGVEPVGLRAAQGLGRMRGKGIEGAARAFCDA